MVDFEKVKKTPKGVRMFGNGSNNGGLENFVPSSHQPQQGQKIENIIGRGIASAGEVAASAITGHRNFQETQKQPPVTTTTGVGMVSIQSLLSNIWPFLVGGIVVYYIMKRK